MSFIDIFKRKAVTKGTETDWGQWYPNSKWGDSQYGQSNLLAEYSKVGDAFENNSTVYSAIDRIGSNISQVPFQILDAEGEVQPESNAIHRLFNYPAKNWNQYILFDSLVKNLELHGTAYLIGEAFRSSPVGTLPSVLWVANSAYMKPVLDKGELKYFEYGTGSKIMRFEESQVTFFRYWSPNNPWEGTAPLRAARLGILLQWYANQYNTKFFKDGGMIAGYWTSNGPRPLTPSQEKQLDDTITNKSRSGLDTAHKTPVIQGATFNQVGVAQKDMQFVDQMRMSKEDILEVFRVPKSLLGLADTTFNNASEAKKSFWTQKLMPIMKMIEQFLVVGFFKQYDLDYSLKFDLTTIPELQEDISELVQTAERLWQMGVPLNMVNETLNLGLPADIPGGDETHPKVPAPILFSEEDIIRKYEIKKATTETKNMAYDLALRIGEQNKAARAMISYEKTMLAKLKKFWKTQYTTMIKAIKDDAKSATDLSKSDLSKADLSKSILSDLKKTLINLVESLRWDIAMVESISVDIMAANEAGIRRIYSAIGIPAPALSEATLLHLSNRGLLLKNSTDEMVALVSKSIKDALTTEELVKALSHDFNIAESKARNIARTESTNAYNAGRVDGMRSLGIKRKQWINSGDSNVRDSHRINQIVGVDELFTLGSGARVPYPGTGPASEACNCRCSVISILTDDDVERFINIDITKEGK